MAMLDADGAVRAWLNKARTRCEQGKEWARIDAPPVRVAAVIGVGTMGDIAQALLAAGIRRRLIDVDQATLVRGGERTWITLARSESRGRLSATVAAARALAQRMGKLPALCGDAWSFIGNPMFEGYLVAADELQLGAFRCCGSTPRWNASDLPLAFTTAHRRRAADGRLRRGPMCRGYRHGVDVRLRFSSIAWRSPASDPSA